MPGLSEKKVAFIGSGIIAGVFIERLIQSGVTAPKRILASDSNPARLAEVERLYGVQVSPRNADAAEFGDIVFLAIPPNAVLKELGELRGVFREDQLIVSLAAAIPVAAMEEVLGRALAVVRVIPNTPSLVGAGMNPHCVGANLSPEQTALLDELLVLLGATIRVGEPLMNISTALTAVGPTYVFPVIKALAEAAVRHGMPAEAAQRAAAQTVMGAARLVLDTGRSPDDLKLMIGTRTISEEGTAAVFTAAVDTAYTKIQESQQKLDPRR